MSKKIKVDIDKCCYCGGCVGVCPVNALELQEIQLRVDYNKCNNCLLCLKFCPVGAIIDENGD